MVGARIDTFETADRIEPVDMAAVQADLRQAYERGRTDERATRRRHPIGMTLTFAAALVGVVVLLLAAANGSFTGAGGVIDHNLAIAVNRAEPQVRDAASQAGQSLKDAGESVKAKAAGTSS